MVFGLMISKVHNELNCVVARDTLVTFYLLRSQANIFGLIEIDSKISKFGQVGPDIYHFIDLSLAIRGHLGNMQIKKLPLGEI